MASLIIGGGVALHDLYKSHQKKKAAKHADQANNQDGLQADNQQHFGHIQAQDPSSGGRSSFEDDTDAPPAYNDVVDDRSRRAALDARRRVLAEQYGNGQQVSSNTRYAAPQSQMNQTSEADRRRADALKHPAYRPN